MTWQGSILRWPLFARKQIPYSVQAALAQEGYVTLEDIADRWDDPAAARTNGPRALGFESGANGFTDQSSAFTAMRLFQAIKAAKDMALPPARALRGPGSSLRQATAPHGMGQGNWPP